MEGRGAKRKMALPRYLSFLTKAMRKEAGEAKPPLTTSELIWEKHSRELTQTAVEQDLLDGGTGVPIYVFTPEEASNPGWGEDGAPNSRNIRHLFNGGK